MRFGPKHPIESLRGRSTVTPSRLRRTMQARMRYLDAKAKRLDAANLPFSFVVDEMLAWATVDLMVYEDLWRGYETLVKGKDDDNREIPETD